MKADERISALLSDYRLAHGRDPRRITVSAEVARELEAIFDAREAVCIGTDFKPVRLREGRTFFFQGIPVMADLDTDRVLDVR